MKRGWIIKFVFPRLALLKEIYDYLSSKPKVKKMQTPAKVAIGGIVGFFFVLLFFFVGFPKIIKSQIKGQLTLKKNSDIRELFTNTPFPLVFKMYLFNVTNYKEVATGEIPVVDEIGPYVFDEWKKKIDLVDNDTDDTLTYRWQDTFIFNKEMSAPLTMDETIVLPHPMIVGMSMLLHKTNPGMLNLAGKALKAIFTDNLDHPFYVGRVGDILFDGATINCTSKDFAAKAVCTQLPTQVKGLVVVEENIFKFSLFGPRNGTAGTKFKAYRGIKNSRDLGRLLEVDDNKEMDVWPTKECNQYSGTDSTIFPPFLSQEEGLDSFAPDLCRSLKAFYVGPAVYDGIKCNKYSAVIGDMSTDPNMKCYCPKEDQCYKKGLMELTACAKVPLIASLPHFYDSDEMYLKGVRGLHPKEEDHAIPIFFEPMTGTPLSARKRLQFNFPLAPIEKVKCMNNMPETILPVFWIEEGVDVNRTWSGQLVTLFTVIKVVKISRWLLLVACLAMACIAGFFQFKGQNSVNITPIKKVHSATEKHNVISMVNQGQNEVNGRY